MKAKIILPNRTLSEVDIDKASIPGTEGYFQILPRHIDFVSSIKPGILTLFFGERQEYYAVHYGMAVKRGDSLHIACLYGMKGDSLEGLSRTLAEHIRSSNEYEEEIKAILKKMEAETLRRFIEMD